MELNFTTKTDFQVFKDYWMFCLFEKKGTGKTMNAFAKFVMVLCILIGIALALVIVNLVVMDGAMGVIPYILLVAVAAAFISCYITVTKTQPKRQYKTVKEAVENPQKYTFAPEQMEVREWDAEEKRDTFVAYRYSDLLYAYETAKAFYLFISDINAFLIPRDQLDAKTQENLAALLREKMGDRFLKSKKCA